MHGQVAGGRQQGFASNTAAGSSQAQPSQSLPSQRTLAQTNPLPSGPSSQPQPNASAAQPSAPLANAAQNAGNAAAAVPAHHMGSDPVLGAVRGEPTRPLSEKAVALQGSAKAETAVPSRADATLQQCSALPVAMPQDPSADSGGLPLLPEDNSSEKAKAPGVAMPDSQQIKPLAEHDSIQVLPQAQAAAVDGSAKPRGVNEHSEPSYSGFHGEASEKAFSDAFLA